ncbi:MAG: DUF2797 domain-containing protein [Gammaproteobacteria bacterium]
MALQGHLRKLRVEHDAPVTYRLRLDEAEETLNDYIGREIALAHTGDIHCVACGRRTSRSFNQGYCFPCARGLARCDICIVRPERCHFHEGTCREPDWGQAHCMRGHVVYLANSSGLKVGITRESQIPTRWIDQGARQALPILRVASRLVAGLAEVAIGRHVADKTDWRRMLKGDPEPRSLATHRDELLDLAGEALDAIVSEFGTGTVEWLSDAEEVGIDYPVVEYPEKVRALNFDKTPELSGRLMGIKGQYLILDTGVLNVRKYAGYEVTFEG